MRLFNRVPQFFLIVVITLILFEITLRITGFDLAGPLVGLGHRAVQVGPFMPHPTRFWSLTPSYEQTEVNARGFRGPDLSVNKPDDRYRVFCLGNSCTYGTSCYYKQSYPARLQEMFDVGFGENRVEVVNAGVPAYSSLQLLRYLKEDILKYDPDMLIVQYGENDREEGNNLQQFPSAVFFRLQPWLIKSKLFQTGYALFYGLKKYAYLHNAEYKEHISRDSFRDCLDNLEEIEGCARKNGINVYFITPAWVSEGELCRKVKFVKNPQIDIFPALNVPNADLASLYIDSHHWFPSGHYLVASAIYNSIYQAIVSDMQQQGN